MASSKENLGSGITIGVLALQGDFAEHIAMLTKCGVNAIDVRHAHQLKELDGLVVPGGESTTIAKLTSEQNTNLFDTIKKRAITGMPVYGTCMGAIFLAKEIENSTQGRLGIMDIKVRRNGFGPQRASFQTSVSIPELGAEPFPTVFIRAPVILSAGANVTVMANLEEKNLPYGKNQIVMARQDNLLATSFHPELTDDLRVHEYFLAMVEQAKHSNRHSAIS